MSRHAFVMALLLMTSGFSPSSYALIDAEVAPREAPFTSFLRPVGYFCGAVRIAERYLLTAAHCVTQGATSTTGIFQDQTQFWTPAGQDYHRFYMKNVVAHVHPDWIAGTMAGKTPDEIADDPMGNDIAIIEFDPNSDSSASPAIIELLPVGLKATDEVFVTGSGCESRAERNSVGQYRQASTRLAGLDPGRARTVSTRYCLGDSGSPVFVFAGGKWWLTGIASTSTPDRRNDVFSRVDAGSATARWIDGIVSGSR